MVRVARVVVCLMTLVVAVTAIPTAQLLAPAAEEPKSPGFSCWKVCGLYAVRKGMSGMTQQQESHCCAAVHRFQQHHQVLVGLAASSASLSPPRADSVGALPVEKRDKAQENEDRLVIASVSTTPSASPVEPSPTPSPSVSQSETVTASASVDPEPLPASMSPSESPEPSLPVFVESQRLLVAITTAPDHFTERRAIRETWMRYLKTSQLTPAQIQKTQITFFIGAVSQGLEQWEGVEAQIGFEMAEFGDIVRLPGTFVESYATLTHKTVEIMQYAHDHEFMMLFKTDDDSFVRVDSLWAEIEGLAQPTRSFVGHCTQDFPVDQNPESKNFMGDLYPHETIPMLCHGGGYLIGRFLYDYIVQHREELTMYRNEDAAVSIWLLNEESHGPKLFLEPNLPVTFFWQECGPDSVYLNPMRVEDQYTAWRNVNEGARNVCAHGFQLQEFQDLLDSLDFDTATS